MGMIIPTSMGTNTRTTITPIMTTIMDMTTAMGTDMPITDMTITDTIITMTCAEPASAS